MQMIARILLIAAFMGAPIVASAHNELVREPRGIDTLVPASPAAAGGIVCAEDYDLHGQDDRDPRSRHAHRAGRGGDERQDPRRRHAGRSPRLGHQPGGGDRPAI